MEDPQRLNVYAAEDAVRDTTGPRLRRWAHVEPFFEQVIGSPHYIERFPDAPLEIGLGRRSHNARSSVAVVAHRQILIRDGSWNALTVLHELAHLVAPGPPPHGPSFVATELELVRLFCGFVDHAALARSFAEHGVTASHGPLAPPARCD